MTTWQHIKMNHRWTEQTLYHHCIKTKQRQAHSNSQEPGATYRYMEVRPWETLSATPRSLLTDAQSWAACGGQGGLKRREGTLPSLCAGVSPQSTHTSPGRRRSSHVILALWTSAAPWGRRLLYYIHHHHRRCGFLYSTELLTSATQHGRIHRLAGTTVIG